METKFNFSFVKKIIDTYIELYRINLDDIRLENGSYIYYANGNDGTDFDYIVNENLCEFGCVSRSTDYYIIKMYITASGKYRIFIYDKDEPQKLLVKETHELSTIIDPAEFGVDTIEEVVKIFAEYLYGSLDQHEIWDSLISSWELSERVIFYYPNDDEDYY